MPLVKVRYQPLAVSDELLVAFGPALCFAVAKHFDCPGGELSEDDVVVMFEEASRFDINTPDIMIDLEAMHFALRDKGDEAIGQPNFTTRTKGLGDDISQMVPSDVSFNLWAKLNNATWYADSTYEPEGATTVAAETPAVPSTSEANTAGLLVASSEPTPRPGQWAGTWNPR